MSAPTSYARLVLTNCLAGSLLLPAAAEPSTASIEFVAPSVARSQSPRPAAGVFVLDLDGLESPFAARDLVDNWRQHSPRSLAPICWVHGSRDDELIEAARILVAGPMPTCTRVLVGLRGR